MGILSLLIRIITWLDNSRFRCCWAFSHCSLSISRYPGLLLRHRRLLIKLFSHISAMLFFLRILPIFVLLIVFSFSVSKEALKQYLVKIDNLALNFLVAVCLHVLHDKQRLRISSNSDILCSLLDLSMCLFIKLRILISILFLEKLQVPLLKFRWYSLVVRNVLVHLHH